MVGSEEWRRVRVVRDEEWWGMKSGGERRVVGSEEWRRVRVVRNEGSEERCWMIGSLLAGIYENRSR